MGVEGICGYYRLQAPTKLICNNSAGMVWGDKPGTKTTAEKFQEDCCVQLPTPDPNATLEPTPEATPMPTPDPNEPTPEPTKMTCANALPDDAKDAVTTASTSADIARWGFVSI